jgi:hypothetical protein
MKMGELWVPMVEIGRISFLIIIMGKKGYQVRIINFKHL